MKLIGSVRSMGAVKNASTISWALISYGGGGGRQANRRGWQLEVPLLEARSDARGARSRRWLLYGELSARAAQQPRNRPPLQTSHSHRQRILPPTHALNKKRLAAETTTQAPKRLAAGGGGR